MIALLGATGYTGKLVVAADAGGWSVDPSSVVVGISRQPNPTASSVHEQQFHHGCESTARCQMQRSRTGRIFCLHVGSMCNQHLCNVWIGPRHNGGVSVGILRLLFDVHVLELAGVEDFAALLALDELRFFIAAHDLHTRVLTGLLHVFCVLKRRRRF